ncbi:hypothetical protein Hanom_Chr16g01430411 [Helianthus anomalus]
MTWIFGVFYAHGFSCEPFWGINWDLIILISYLACSYSWLVDDGLKLFGSIEA